MALERFDPAADETVTLKADRSSSSPACYRGRPRVGRLLDGERITREPGRSGEKLPAFRKWDKAGLCCKERSGKVPAEMPANSVVKGLNRVRNSEVGRDLTLNVNPLLSTSQR